jgi:hypothetical protein
MSSGFPIKRFFHEIITGLMACNFFGEGGGGKRRRNNLQT